MTLSSGEIVKRLTWRSMSMVGTLPAGLNQSARANMSGRFRTRIATGPTYSFRVGISMFSSNSLRSRKGNSPRWASRPCFHLAAVRREPRGSRFIRADDDITNDRSRRVEHFRMFARNGKDLLGGILPGRRLGRLW